MSNTKIQTCTVTGRTFTVPEGEGELLHRVALANPWIGSALPSPDIYPSECVRQMSSFGNQLFLHRAESAISGQSVFSRFAPGSGYRVVTSDEFWSDEIDNRQFGTPYDFTRSFFDQWDDLMRRCMLLPLLNDRNENCEFANGCFNCKSCYLCFDTTESEECLYCFACHQGLQNLLCAHADTSSYCYHCSDISNCYECQLSTDCRNCSNCFGCLDCRSCTNCYGCAGLANACYCVFNEQLTKEEFSIFLRDTTLVAPRQREEFMVRARSVHRAHGAVANRTIQCEDCSGSYLRQSSNLIDSFNSIGSRDCIFIVGSINSRDLCKGFGYNCELGYNAVSNACYNCHFSYCTSHCNSCWYSYYLFNNCADCFGCVGLKKNRFCLLNFQYTRAEYEELLPRVVQHMHGTGEWGRWFPPRIATNTYEEGWADHYLEEISPEEVVRRGYRSAPLTVPEAPPGAIVIDPETFDAADASLSSRPLRCSVTGQLFSFQPKELDFYRRFGIPLPATHWRVRLRELLLARSRMPDLLI